MEDSDAKREITKTCHLHRQVERYIKTQTQTHIPYVCGAAAEMKVSLACLASTL